MIQRPYATTNSWFRVRLGHLRLLVRAETEAAAQSAAREQWRVDLPRLWDVISALPDDRFVVERATCGGTAEA